MYPKSVSDGKVYLYQRIQKKEIVIFDLLEMVNID
jgi:hypothetical protein